MKDEQSLNMKWNLYVIKKVERGERRKDECWKIDNNEESKIEAEKNMNITEGLKNK